MILRLAHGLADARKLSFGALFLDVVQAFYRTLREILLRSPLDDESIACVVRAAGLPPAAMHELTRRIRDHGAMLTSVERVRPDGTSSTTVDAHVLAQTEQCYRTPWFICEGSQQISLPQRSVFPGQPLADVLYDLLMADCMNEVRRRLISEGFALHLPTSDSRNILTVLAPEDPDGTSPLLDIAFADDGTIMIMMPACTIYAAMCRALVVISDVFSARGHLLNIGPGKTAALLAIRGPGTKQAKRSIWHEHAGKLQGVSSLLGNVVAPVVRNYIHLGSVLDAAGSMMPEIKHRAQTTTDTLRILRTRVFAPPALCDGTRMTFADSLVMSGRLYNAGTWPALTLGEVRQVEVDIMKVYRAAAKVRFVEEESCVSNAQVLARLQRPPPEVLLRAARLRLLGSLVHSGPLMAFALLRAHWHATGEGIARDRTWMGMVMQDCEWLRYAAPRCTDMPSPLDDFAPWQALISRSQPGWKKLIGQAMHATAQAHMRKTNADTCEKDFFEAVGPAGVPPRVFTDVNGQLVDPPAPPTVPDMRCPWCYVVYKKRAAFRSHIARTHRQLSGLARSWAAPSGQCHACLAQFHDRRNLVDHLAIDSTR